MDTPWQPVLQGEMAERANAFAMQVVKRCSSVVTIRKSLKVATLGTPIRWNPVATAGGYAGIALLLSYAHLCAPDCGWDKKAHSFLLGAVNACSDDRYRRSVALFGGISGLAFTVQSASENGKHYSGLRRQLDHYLAQLLPAFLNSVQTSGIRIGSYDLVSGVTGVTAYLLTRDTALDDDLTEYCRDALQYLVTLVSSKAHNCYLFISPENIQVEERRKSNPDGYVDCGLAHGVPGVIAILAIALRQGRNVPGMREALTTLTQWFLSQKVEDAYGINWPMIIDSTILNSRPSTGWSRAAWCYGVPGIARSLYLAGRALDNESVCNVGLSGLTSLLLRPRKLWRVFSPNFCHGLSGILQTSLRMYHDTGDMHLITLIQQITEEILSLYSPTAQFGFQDKRLLNGPRYDNPRLLEGAPGVALTLLAASNPVRPDWDRLFLLS